VAPWNGGSGFFPKDRKEGIDAIAGSTAGRFREFRETILAIRGWPELAALADERESAKSGKKPKGDGKQEMVRACRNRLCDRVVDWLDAVIVMRTEGDLAYPPVLGTAGNEGRLDYTNTFMCRISELLLAKAADSETLLRNALAAEGTSGFVQSPTGQYDPGRAGGYNQGPGIESKDFPTNPWSFVLAMEGTVAWAGGVARRQGIGLPRHAVSPFTVSASAVGYGSAAEKEQGTARAEIWMPLWSRPARFEEIQHLLREGRAEIGRRQASNGIQFAEAATTLGVDRGIEAFARYSLVKRRGDSYVALPAGRFPVRYLKATDLLQDLDPYLARLAKGLPQIPARIGSARRNVDRAVYEFVLRGTETEFREIIAALGRLEMEVWLRSTRREGTEMRFRPRPLRPEWLLFAGGSIEMRVATALASVARSGDVADIGDQIRGGAWIGRSVAARLASVLHRRMIEAERGGSKQNPVFGWVRLSAADISAFCEGATGDDDIEALLFGLTLVDWAHEHARKACGQLQHRWSGPVTDRPVSRAWALLKHVFLPGEYITRSGQKIAIRAEPRIVPLLIANRASEACAIAQARLRASGLPPLKVELGLGEEGIRLAGALLVPLRGRDVSEISRLVLEDQKEAAMA
jgi:CRISPR-associated protein Csx17